MTSSFDWDTFYAASLVSSGLADPDELPAAPDEPGPDQRWSTWSQTAHTLDRGPQPFPDWVVQHDGAIDTELGVLKTGKEADAFLLERALPGHSAPAPRASGPSWSPSATAPTSTPPSTAQPSTPRGGA